MDYRKIQPTDDPKELNVLKIKNQDKSIIYVIKDETNILYGIKTKEFYDFYKLPFEIVFFDYEEFLKSMEPIIGDDVKLMSRVKHKELKLKDMKEIITTYNQNKRHQ